MDTQTLDVATIRKKGDTAEELLIPVRRKLYAYDPKDIARRVGVSRSTVEAFRSGRTVWPRPSTLFGILEAMGYRLVLVSTDKLN